MRTLVTAASGAGPRHHDFSAAEAKLIYTVHIMLTAYLSSMLSGLGKESSTHFTWAGSPAAAHVTPFSMLWGSRCRVSVVVCRTNRSGGSVVS